MPFFVTYAHHDFRFHVPGSSQSRCDRLIGFGKSKHGKLPYPKS